MLFNGFLAMSTLRASTHKDSFDMFQLHFRMKPNVSVGKQLKKKNVLQHGSVHC